MNTLPPGPFQMTGPTMPYDAYTGDTIHQFFQMYQQMDCAIDKEHVTRRNPTGCLHDLQSAITTTYSTAPGGTPHDTGQTMAFFNMQQGDVPYFKFLADHYTMSDNYHQPVMGGTGPDSVPLGFADQVFFSDGKGNAVTPPATSIYDPDPQPNTLNLYKSRKQWFNCSDQHAAGDPADRRLPEQAAISAADEVCAGRLLQRGQHQPRLDSTGDAERRGQHSAGDHDQHRRFAQREKHLVEVLWRQLQCFRNRRAARRNLLQHLQSVRVSGRTTLRCVRITCGT